MGESGKRGSKTAHQRPGQSPKHGCLWATCVGKRRPELASHGEGARLICSRISPSRKEAQAAHITDVYLAKIYIFKIRKVSEVWSKIFSPPPC